MKITSMDISNKEFKRVIRGYDPDEVDDFLDKLSEDYETLYKENSSMKEKISNINERLEHYAKMESTIQNTLLLAQNAAEQAKQNAEKESELILKNANESAQKILDKANNDVITIHDEYENLKQEYIKFRSSFRNFMNSQVEMFDSMDKNFMKNYNIGEEGEEVTSQKNSYAETPEKEVDEKIVDENSNPEKDEEEHDDFKVSDIGEDYFNDKNSMNEIKNFFAKE